MNSVACEPGNSVEPYQVRRIAFEYEESPGTYKLRPVVVGVVEVERGDALLVKVTGHTARAPNFLARFDFPIGSMPVFQSPQPCDALRRL